MATYPGIQKNRQEDIDDMVGMDPGRLPNFNDRDSLPYLEAMYIVKSCHVSLYPRWGYLVPTTKVTFAADASLR